jgi:hypothetical protein
MMAALCWKEKGSGVGEASCRKFHGRDLYVSVVAGPKDITLYSPIDAN